MYPKKIFLMIITSILLGQLLSCGKDTSSTDQDNDNELTYFQTTYGGCNGQTDFEGLSLRSPFENDTVFYTIIDDTLRISIAHRSSKNCSPTKACAESRSGRPPRT